jgi:hypothetical protein
VAGEIRIKMKEVNEDSPNEKLEVDEASVSGMNKSLRASMLNIPLKESHLNMQVTVPIHHDYTVWAGSGNSYAMVTRNDAGEVNVGEQLGKADAGEWMTKRSGDKMAAAREILDKEIGNRTLKELGVKEVEEP